MTPAVGKSLVENSHDGTADLDAVATHVNRIKLVQQSYDIGESFPDNPGWLTASDRYFETPRGEIVYVSGVSKDRVYTLYTERDAFEYGKQYSPYSLIQPASELLQTMKEGDGWKLIPMYHQIGGWSCPECGDRNTDIENRGNGHIKSYCSCGYEADRADLVESNAVVKVY